MAVSISTSTSSLSKSSGRRVCFFFSPKLSYWSLCHSDCTILYHVPIPESITVVPEGKITMIGQAWIA